MNHHLDDFELTLRLHASAAHKKQNDTNGTLLVRIVCF